MKLCVMFLSFLLHQGFSVQTSSRILDSNLRQRAYPLLQSIVKKGGHRGLEQCKEKFKNEVWNCPLANMAAYRELPIFIKRRLPFATRETAFAHAISAAAITHEITHQCKQDRIPGCDCAKIKKQPKGDGDWQWGGCSVNIKYGEEETKRFIDNLEKGNDARTAFNLHNNEVGRKVVRANLRRECKCHGLSGTCQLRTCWKRLAQFEVVGAQLKRRYLDAIQVTYKEGKLQEKIRNRHKQVSRRDKRLVYLAPSPDYCVRNLTVGSYGMMGRTCRSDHVSTNDCKALCNSCKLRHQTVDDFKEVKCRCKFVWCCSVKCETCTRKFSKTTCTRR